MHIFEPEWFVDDQDEAWVKLIGGLNLLTFMCFFMQLTFYYSDRKSNRLFDYRYIYKNLKIM